MCCDAVIASSAEPAETSDASGAAVADDDLFPLDDNRNLALTARELQHRVQILRGGFNIDISVPAIGLTGLLGIGSSRFSVDANRFSH